MSQSLITSIITKGGLAQRRRIQTPPPKPTATVLTHPAMGWALTLADCTCREQQGFHTLREVSCSSFSWQRRDEEADFTHNLGKKEKKGGGWSQLKC